MLNHLFILYYYYYYYYYYIYYLLLLFIFIIIFLLIKANASGAKHGFPVLIEVLRKLRATDYINDPPKSDIPEIVSAVCSRVDKCIAYLGQEEGLSPLSLPFGTLSPPFGVLRYAVVELLEATALTNTSYVFDSFAAGGGRLVPTLLDLFFRYKWNNFLHQSVYNILAVAIPSQHKQITTAIFGGEGALVSRILDAEDENKKELASRGYMDHLTKLTSLIEAYPPKCDDVSGDVDMTGADENKRWKDYVSGAYAERSKKESVKLGSGMSYVVAASAVSSLAPVVNPDEPESVIMTAENADIDMKIDEVDMESNNNNDNSNNGVNNNNNNINFFDSFPASSGGGGSGSGGDSMSFFDNPACSSFFDAQPPVPPSQAQSQEEEETNFASEAFPPSTPPNDDNFFASIPTQSEEHKEEEKEEEEVKSKDVIGETDSFFTSAPASTDNFFADQKANEGEACDFFASAPAGTDNFFDAPPTQSGENKEMETESNSNNANEDFSPKSE